MFHSFASRVTNVNVHVASSLYKQLSDMSKYTIIGVGATVSLTAIGVSYWYYRKNAVPSKWKKVGEISELMCFPLKSGGVIREAELECTTLGVKKGMMRDRIFMIVSERNGEFVSARTYPSILKIAPKIQDNTLTLVAPGMIDHVLNIDDLYKKEFAKTNLRGDVLSTIDCGGEAAKWVSRFLLREDAGFRLVFHPYDYPIKRVSDENKWLGIIQSDNGSFTDETSYMLCTETSVAELNTRVENKVNAQRFRPNFVVKGTATPYEEDNWDWIKIGRDAVFRRVRPCTRCVFTNLDPDTGDRDKTFQPLKTLKEYRQLEDPKLRAALGDSPVFGAHLGLRVPGIVHLGDTVYVNVKA